MVVSSGYIICERHTCVFTCCYSPAPDMRTDTLINKNTGDEFFCHLPRAYLKKSFLQYSLPSREKHFSVKLHLHSQHCTHLTCQALSSTLSRKRSRIGLSQPAQWTMALAGLQPHKWSTRTNKINSTGRALTEYLLSPSLIRLELPGQCARRSQSIRCHHRFLPACVKRLSVQKKNRQEGMRPRPLSQVEKPKGEKK